MSFTFKKFHIDDSHCGMPVSTDGVILGAWANIENRNRILDIGAGSGLLSLMIAQRLTQYLPPCTNTINVKNLQVIAVELDDLAAQDCQFNIVNSPWAAIIEFQHASIQRYTAQHLAQCSPRFNSIICNPPYFDNGPQSERQERATARHTDTLSFSELLRHIAMLLTENGNASLILPVESESRFVAELTSTTLEISKRVAVSTVKNKPARRLLIELKHQSQCAKIVLSDFVISDLDGQYSDQMKDLCKAFYLKL